MLFKKYIQQELGVQVVKELKFHPKRKWRTDYAIPDKKVAIEIEGGAWTNGRHTRGKGFIADMEKYNAMTVFGWRLLRFTPDQMFKKKTLETIKALTL